MKLTTRILTAGIFALLGVLIASPAYSQAPCQWNYSFDASGNAVATYCGNVVVNGGIVSGGGTTILQFTGDGATASFPTGVAVPAPQTVQVFLNGVQQMNGINYAITGPPAAITFGDPPLNGLQGVAYIPH